MQYVLECCLILSQTSSTDADRKRYCLEGIEHVETCKEKFAQYMDFSCYFREVKTYKEDFYQIHALLLLEYLPLVQPKDLSSHFDQIRNLANIHIGEKHDHPVSEDCLRSFRSSFILGRLEFYIASIGSLDRFKLKISKSVTLPEPSCSQ
eukprot:TRINITY_DN3707_c0_g1_i2.p1 TRINITY_DN3707_c0_g1~~TRINITY_DN3707_c0_g1_i2.p1  ORF type:complete len:150 (-),score=7.93 TRINITY_DN3707_c0_g1_i2:196-645(-)